MGQTREQNYRAILRFPMVSSSKHRWNSTQRAWSARSDLSTAVLLRVFAIMVLVTPVLGQTSRGGVAGTVTDPSGAVIVDAQVCLTHNETGVIRSVRTNDVGIYRFDAVDLGTFNLQI